MIQGVYTALITPFLPSGAFDEEGFIELIKMQVKAKVHGIVVLGTTGETPTLTPQEKKKIIQLAREYIKGKTSLIVGVGSNSTLQTIQNIKLANELGADGALVVTPYYNKPTQDGLFEHYKAVAESTTLPIMLYNVPGRTGINLQVLTVKKLSLIQNIVAIKEACGNISQIMELIEQVVSEKPKFKVFSGDDNLTLPTIALGGAGIVSVVSNLVPELVVDYYEAAIKGDLESARRLHYELLPLFRGAFIESNPIPIKALMQMSKLPSGPCRLPLTKASGETEKKLRQLHETLKLPLLQYEIR